MLRAERGAGGPAAGTSDDDDNDDDDDDAAHPHPPHVTVRAPRPQLASGARHVLSPAYAPGTMMMMNDDDDGDFYHDAPGPAQSRDHALATRH